MTGGSLISRTRGGKTTVRTSRGLGAASLFLLAFSSLLPPATARPQEQPAEQTGTIRGILDHPILRRTPGAVYIGAIDGETFDPPAVNPVMDQKNMMFTPHVLAVPVGSTIEFPNSDEARHNVYTSNASVCRFQLGIYGAGIVKRVACDKPGVIMVLCNVHAEMRGFIVVSPTPYLATTDSAGEFVIEGVPPGTYSLTFEHERLMSKALEVTVTAGAEAYVEFTGLKRKR